MELPFEGGPEVAVVPCTEGWMDGFMFLLINMYHIIPVFPWGY